MIQTVWTEVVEVQTHETDLLQRWRPSGLFRAIQTAGQHHASHLGYDYREMLLQNQSWVLARVRVEFERFPQAGEKITIQTWPKCIQQKLFFVRDFWITDASDQLVARASSAFVLIDTQARRILPPRALGGDLPSLPEKAAISSPLEKIVEVGQPSQALVRTAGYSVVDLMGHVNNAVYVDWVCDALPSSYFQERHLAAVQVNYNKEVRPAESVSIQVGQLDGQMSLKGVNQTTGEIAFEAQVEWR
ncbi:hypothetical protein ADN00_11010 [Ornatilinea apprima]|uniref:Acyl-ACP thioesterase n=1 Tax=Ornatilinea apprima TaxID=1134406 RepID=A0A0P6XKF7_9CHLR|nr:acyl-ACP thioesterase domain-containing protein [Ornatilinea apprima]KPL76495.1 hypothetical protein ADN00_11010 [Ornatilinea apprima]